MAGTSLERHRLEASVTLLRLPLTTSERSALLTAVDLAVDLTDSAIGYLHYLNDDQVTIELSTWSTHTRDYCTANFDRHYPLDSAGIWADTARTRSAQVHNDYSSVRDRRGLPEGHSALTRHLGVAAVDADGVVRLLLGVGNKVAAYDEDDVTTAQGIVDEAWRVIVRLREHHQAARTLALLRARQQTARLATWEWDPGDGRLVWDPEAERVLGLADGSPPGDRWEWLLGRLDDPSRDRLERGLEAGPDGPPLDLDLRIRTDAGTLVPLRLRGDWLPRSQGLGQVLRGTVMDVTLQEEAARATYRATHDAVTGLPNRTWLLEDVARRLAAGLPFAVHRVRLADFAGLTADHGHLVGDDVLRTCADRISSLARGGGAAAFLGGDEFALLQPGPIDPDAATAHATRAVGALQRPVEAAGSSVRLSVAVGIALAAPAGAEDVRALLARADRALRAALSGAGPVVVDDGTGARTNS